LATIVPAAAFFLGAPSPALDTARGLVPQAQADPSRTTVVYVVEGMSCGRCASHVQSALEKISGIESARVSFEKAEATVIWRTQGNDKAVVTALDELGFRAARKTKPAP
jgi:copper chaperone CopZ